mgnify:FL=1
MKNFCSPQSIYGAFDQTLFLGCSVLSFTASAGWNEQSSDVTVELVQDTCSGIKTHYSNYSPNVVNIIDPGFGGLNALRAYPNNAPNIGAPAYFRVANFEYAGIIQSLNQKEGADGLPVYSVKMGDPRSILDNVQVIVDNYEGTINGMHNLVNVYGFLESLASEDNVGVTCPPVTVDGVTFGAPAGGFGYSQRTSQGIPWNNVKTALQVLLGNPTAIVAPDYSLGGIFGRGGAGGGFGEISTPSNGPARYIIDISEIPFAPTHYRISGPIVSLSQLISQVCADAGCDYYVELLPTANVLVIKVRVLSRTNQPTIGTTTGIVDFITSAGTTGAGVISDSIGRELRNEPNNAFLIGGKVRSFYEETSEGNITPFWGWDADGKLIESNWDGVDWEVDLDFRKINLALITPVSLGLTGGTHGKVWEGELRAALGGFDTFKNFVLNPDNHDTVLKQYFRDTLSSSMQYVESENEKQMGTASNVVSGIDGAVDAANVRDAKTIFNWINSYASDFYGKQYLVAIPFLCYDTEPDTQQLIWSDEPSTEGGWTDQTDVLGITQPSFEADLFKDDQNKWQPLLRWPDSTGVTGINLDKLNQSDYLNSSDYVWLKASMDAKWVTGNPVTGLSDEVASALLTLSSPIIAKTTGVIDSHAGVPLMSVVKGVGDSLKAPRISGSKSSLGARSVTSQAMAKRALKPSAAGIPLMSNTQTYGPWYKISTLDAAGRPVPGNVHAEVDDGLTPWEYGGTGFMDLAGLAKVDTAVTAMQFAERGEVTVPGYPTRGLGASLTQPLTLYPSRVLSQGTITIGATTYIYNYVSTVPSTAGANISNLSTNVGPGGVTTSYSLSTYTPVFGRFAKGNAERIKQIGDNKVRTARNLRAQTALKQMLNTATARGAAAADI